MLFNSYTFILLFLPATFAIYHALRRYGARRTAIAFLTIASLAFSGWWNVTYLPLLIAMIIANFFVARWLVSNGDAPHWVRQSVLIVGLAGNLATLGYFKYANFLVANIDELAGLDITLATIVLPLGISFFVFQKIALLVDAYRGRLRSLDFLDYALFVTFFPQLIAGPIVHHSEVIPQFHRRERIGTATIVVALAAFSIGLAKKVLLADNLALFATPVFDAAAAGGQIGAIETWVGVLAYTLQLYFDFSGYCDMAIGGALLFGVRLPLNFASPYKASSIIDFWRRWHMTLSRFLRDYLYIPLGGSRSGEGRRYANLLITMLLGGLWHGAGWTFVAWGALHGFYLTINHLWRKWRGTDVSQAMPGRGGVLASQALTFFAVMLAWTFFRADSFGTAMTMLRAMSGFGGAIGSADAHIDVLNATLLIAPLLAIVWLAPNTQELIGYIPPSGSGDNAPAVRATRRLEEPGWAVALGATFALGLLSLSKVSEFLYFQF
jgi:D-alanyl-lipoteichoic acid acyltransferase DltB (MBOAT superfamily)